MLTFSTVLHLATQMGRKKESEPYRLPLKKNLKLELYDRPGLWQSEEESHKLVTELRQIYQESMEEKVAEYGVLLGEKEDLKKRVIVLVRDEQQKPIAFCALARLEVSFGYLIEEVIHLGLVAIVPAWRKARLQGALYSIPVVFLFFQGGLMRLFFTNITQVPAIFGQCEDYFDDVYPSSKLLPDGTTRLQNFHHARISSSIYQHHKRIFGVGEDSIFEPRLQIIQNSYTGGSDLLKKTFEQSAKHRRSSVNEFCKKHLNYERGDDFIQVGQMDYRAMLRFVSARPDQSVLKQGCLSTLTWIMQTTLIPILQWIVKG